MFEVFDQNRSRYASGGVVSTMPSELIDSIWVVIDLYLKGVIPLDNLITFQIQNRNGQTTLLFSQTDSNLELGVDLPFLYDPNFPKQVYAYDDGQRQTILLPADIE